MALEEAADPSQTQATMSNFDLDDSPLLAMVCARTAVSRTATLQKKFRSGTLSLVPKEEC